jgi:NADH:ubiquinone oxidoreductase subunit 4 (subunit M)
MDFFAHHILSVVLFTPLVGALLLLFIPRENEQAHKIAGNVFGVLGFLVSPSRKLRIGFPSSARNIISASTASASCSSCSPPFSE